MLKKILIGISSVVVVLIVAAIAGQFGRDLAQKTIASKEEIQIKRIADQYADASKKMTSSLTEFAEADQKIKSSVDQLKSLKELLLESKNAFELHEEIREKGLNYLLNSRNAFEKEFYDDMLFSFGLEAISECNQAFAEFSSKYVEFINYSIVNFDKIISSVDPEITYYNKKLKNCEILRQKYNEAYLKKMNAIKRKYGDAEVN
jgi:hypothetical protein